MLFSDPCLDIPACIHKPAMSIP